MQKNAPDTSPACLCLDPARSRKWLSCCASASSATWRSSQAAGSTNSEAGAGMQHQPAPRFAEAIKDLPPSLVTMKVRHPASPRCQTMISPRCITCSRCCRSDAAGVAGAPVRRALGSLSELQALRRPKAQARISTARALLRDQRTLSHEAVGAGRQPLAQPDGVGPAPLAKLNRHNSCFSQDASADPWRSIGRSWRPSGPRRHPAVSAICRPHF